MTPTTLRLDITIDPVKLKENHVLPEILEILQSVRPTWDADLVKAKVFTGGISNLLFGYYLDGKFAEDVVLLRVYGEGSDLMIDRNAEAENIQSLHAAGCCPPLYALFKNGIVYGFVAGDTLDENSVRDPVITRLIAEEMIQMHTLKPKGREVVPGLWKKLENFIDLIPDSFDDPDKQKQYLAIVDSKAALRQEVEELRTHLEALHSPVVFSHNDLLLKNIIYNQEKNCVNFIDHEYAMYNYEHFEIGNHFCEYVGVDEVDFTLYPDKAYQLKWLQYYLERKCERSAANATIDDVQQNGQSAIEVTSKDVETCYVMVNKFALAAHMFWGMWSLVQARLSAIDFNYLEYAGLKLGEYHRRKEEFLGLKMPE